MKDSILAFRRAGVPLAAIETSDPALTIRANQRALNGKADSLPVMQWDCMRGLVGVNDIGAQVAREISPQAFDTQNPAECLERLSKQMPEDGIVYFHNAQRIIDNPSVIQGLWNARDTFKERHALAILLAPMLTLPGELKNDVCLVSEPLPNETEIGSIVDELFRDAKLAAPDDREKIIDALLGLSAFGAEQSLALAIRKDGLDRENLWERKRKMIEQTKGLSVWRGGERFADIGGCDNVKRFLGGIMGGKEAPRAIVFIDEIEKALGGSTGDTSGVSQDQLGVILSFMQDTRAAGMIFIGPPGAAKSMMAKATGNEFNRPTIQFDLGGMKGSLVGQSEQAIRDGLRVAEAVGQGRLLFIATCNSFGNLPPELKRRFKLGTFFFDLPTADERAAIWEKYVGKYSLPLQSGDFSDDGWTGAEIAQCCEVAYRTGYTLKQASEFVVPVAKSAAETIDTLRRQAAGKFISASAPGFYQFNLTPVQSSGRRFERE